MKECGSHMQLLTGLAIYFNKVWISCWYNLKLMSPLQVGEKPPICLIQNSSVVGIYAL